MNDIKLSVTIMISTTAELSPELLRFELPEAIRKALNMPDVVGKFNHSNGATMIRGYQIHSATEDRGL